MRVWLLVALATFVVAPAHALAQGGAPEDGSSDPPSDPIPADDGSDVEPPGDAHDEGAWDPPGDDVEPPEPESAAEGDFGPRLMIEKITVTGNTVTQTELIRRTLPFGPGDVVLASDKRLRDARFRVLALGFFRDVNLVMSKGSARGQVAIEIQVLERGTVVLNRLWFGTTDVAPYWLGADLGERNLLGLGVAVGAGFVYAASADVAGARDQWATELRVADPSLLGTRWGAHGSFTLVRGSEAYRVAGDPGDIQPADLRAFPYRRFGARAGVTYDVTALSRLSGGLRAEHVVVDLPTAPTLEQPDGRISAIDLHLEPGESRVMTASLSFDRDTRPDPILPHAGGHLTVGVELGSSLLGGSYEFATIFGRYEHYWPVFRGRHTIGLKLAGGTIIGDAPRFDRIHVADVNRMLTPRALGLVLSAAAPLDILGTRPDKPTYGDLGGSANVEYAFELFRGTGKNRVYGGDLFFGFGLWGLGERADLRARDTSLRAALPIDVYVDAGVRIDTDVGVFEITIANALGRLR